MLLLAAHQAIADLLAEMPGQIHDMLEHVTCQLMQVPPPGVPCDTKGMFCGQQQVGPDERGEVLALAHGSIQLYAANLEDADEAQQAVCHEIGHALGLTEWGVAELGLAA